MKQEIKYIEKMNGLNHDGEAWIGLVSFSKSGKTLYFNGKAFQSAGSNRNPGNYFDIETGELYWISGVKKNMQDRHIYGKGLIKIEKRILNEYLKIVNRKILPKNQYEIVNLINDYPIERIKEIENEKYSNKFDEKLFFKNPKELKIDELEYLIEQLISDEKVAKFNKTRRLIRKKRNELERELNFRLLKNDK